MANHGGCIAVESREGEGTTFRIYLPLAEPPPKTALKEQGDRTAEKPPAAPAPVTGKEEHTKKEIKPKAPKVPAATAPSPPKLHVPPGKKPTLGPVIKPKSEINIFESPMKRILVADDEEMVRNLCVTVLEKSGFEVMAACDGKEAVEIFEKESGRFDLVILDVLMPRVSGEVAFQKMKALKPGVRVLLSSGFSDESVAQNLFTQGAAGFIEKPYDVPQLISEVNRVLMNK